MAHKAHEHTLVLMQIPPHGELRGRIPRRPHARGPLALAALRGRVESMQLGLGATVQGRVDEGGSFWTVMADPEGNEFCVLRGPEDGWSPE